MKHIAITKEKGGAACTTTATNLAYALAQRGHSVLIVDMDTRGDCGPCMGIDPGDGLIKALRYGRDLTGDASLWGLAQVTAWQDLYLMETNSTSTREALALAEGLSMDDLVDLVRRLSIGCDYVIYDTSVSSGRLREAAMILADLMVIPVRVEALGMADVAELIEAYGRPLQVIVLPVAYDKRLGVHEYNLGVLSEAYGDRVASPIPHRVAVIESQSAMMPVLAYAPDNDASHAYRSFADAVLAGLDSPVIEVLEEEHNPYILTGDELDRAEAMAKRGR